MVGRISAIYFQTYKLAFDQARAAERAYQYERNTDTTFIDFGYCDSLKKGLMAAAGLMLGLNQIEKAYLDNNDRELEIEKTISLLQLMTAEEFATLKETKKCTFHLSRELFNKDFPRHYCRKIKTIAISIPAVIAPYQNVYATLRQTVNRVLLRPDEDGKEYLRTGKSEGGRGTRYAPVGGSSRKSQSPRVSMTAACSS
ncbi:MAG: hypothetical protein ACI9G1_002719 [Pirellulaceae bacterium]|jgi:hypothetical protein